MIEGLKGMAPSKSNNNCNNVKLKNYLNKSSDRIEGLKVDRL